MLPGARLFFEKRGAPTPPLPYDAEVEYLESTGTQYIDTGVPVVNALVGTDIEFQATSTYNNKWIFGMYSGIAGNGFNYLTGSYSGWCVGLYNSSFYRPGIAVDTNRHRVKIYIDGKTMFDDVVLLEGTTTKYDSRQLDFNAYLFASHRSGAPASNYALPGKIFHCKMWVDGNLSRDFIPVRFTNEQNQSEGAMYDRLGVGGMDTDGSPRTDGLYRNRGTGAFLWAEKQ